MCSNAILQRLHSVSSRACHFVPHTHNTNSYPTNLRSLYSAFLYVASTVCGGFSELLDGSGCSGHGKCTQPDLAADPKCDCAVGWGAGKADVGDRCAGVFASTLPQAMHNSSDKELNFYWDSAWGDLSLVEGYRLSKQTNTAKRIAIFQGSMGIRIFTVILAGLMALMSVVFLVMVQKHRKKTIISYAQPLFLQCILAGSFVSYVEQMR